MILFHICVVSVFLIDAYVNIFNNVVAMVSFHLQTCIVEANNCFTTSELLLYFHFTIPKSLDIWNGFGYSFFFSK